MVRTYKVVSCFKMPKRGAKVVPVQSGSGVFTIDMSSTSTLDIAVLIALFFYATGSYQRPVGVAKSISQKMCSVYIQEVTQALIHPTMLNKYISFPKTRSARKAVMQKFHNKYGVPGVVGSVDGSHFKIFGPPKEIEHLYYCRKHYHSLNVQMSVPEASPAPAPLEMQARHSYWWHLLVDLPILLLVTAVCILLEVGALPSRRSGFTCNDPALSFPHTGDTFSISLVAAITIIVPFIIMWVVEAIHHRDDEYNMKQSKMLVSAKASGLIYRDYIYGAVVNLTVLEVVKCVIGSPRPTFFDLCEPDKAQTCNGSEFVTDYKCTSTRFSRYLVIDSTRSFPSAHASLAIYCGLFLAWYLQRRAFSWHNRAVLVVPLVQTLCLIYAAVCALTRVTDHRHHWWDVLVGGTMGAATVLYTVLVLCKNFSQPAVVSTSDISSSDGNNHQSVRRLLSSEPHVVVP